MAAITVDFAKGWDRTKDLGDGLSTLGFDRTLTDLRRSG